MKSTFGDVCEERTATKENAVPRAAVVGTSTCTAAQYHHSRFGAWCVTAVGEAF